MARVPFGKLAWAIRLVRSGMGSSSWACSDILILLLVFMRKLLITFSLSSTLFSFPCPLVRTKFPSRVIDVLIPRFGVSIYSGEDHRVIRHINRPYRTGIQFIRSFDEKISFHTKEEFPDILRKRSSCSNKLIVHQSCV